MQRHINRKYQCKTIIIIYRSNIENSTNNNKQCKYCFIEYFVRYAFIKKDILKDRCKIKRSTFHTITEEIHTVNKRYINELTKVNTTNEKLVAEINKLKQSFIITNTIILINNKEETNNSLEYEKWNMLDHFPKEIQQYIKKCKVNPLDKTKILVNIFNEKNVRNNCII